MMKRMIDVPVFVWLVCTAGLALVSMPPAGFAEQPLEPFVAVAKTPGSLAGVSWTLVTDPSLSGDLSAYSHAEHVPAWLDLHGGKSRAVNREPDLLRHEF